MTRNDAGVPSTERRYLTPVSTSGAIRTKPRAPSNPGIPRGNAMMSARAGIGSSVSGEMVVTDCAWFISEVVHQGDLAGVGDGGERRLVGGVGFLQAGNRLDHVGVFDLRQPRLRRDLHVGGSQLLRVERIHAGPD